MKAAGTDLPLRQDDASGRSGGTGSNAGQDRDPDPFAAHERVTETGDSGSLPNSGGADPQAMEHPSPVAPHDRPTWQPDLEPAERHLTRLDEDAEKFLFVTFDDNKARQDKRLTRVLHGTLDEHAAELTRLNRAGAGVFVTVNQTVSDSRKKEDIVGLRALWKEDDRGDTPLLPLEPQLVVQTSPGKRHEHLLIEGAPLEGREWTRSRPERGEVHHHE